MRANGVKSEVAAQGHRKEGKERESIKKKETGYNMERAL